jgi:cytochrome c-type biogenesis protein CcmH
MHMTLWILFAVMSLVAIGFVVWPLYKHQKGFTPLIGIAVVLVVALSAGLYYKQGQPELPSGSAALPGMDDAVGALAARLAKNPDDANGWKMLGRSYMTTGDYAGAVDAFEKAVELESAGDAQTLVSLGEALLSSTGASIDGRIAGLFENALAIDPNNPQALFYGGIGAFNRGDTDTAADRWEQLLELNPPAEIQGVLRQRIAEWRGEAPPAMAQASPEPETPVPTEIPEQIDRPGVVVAAAISLTDAAVAGLPAEATVYVIARDPAQPVPPIAVARRRLSDLPATVELGDRESMVPGRELSGFTEFELLVRVSASGQPNAQSGDWFGSVLVRPAERNGVALSIDQQVP